MIKVLKKYRKTNPGILFMNSTHEFFETTNNKDIVQCADMYDVTKFDNDEYTNTDGTRGWWLKIWIEKVKDMVTR